MTPGRRRSFSGQYLGPEGDIGHPHASQSRAGDLSGLPPALIAAAGCDPPCDEGRAYGPEAAGRRSGGGSAPVSRDVPRVPQVR
ncbi:alpha/beta hydrolase fold domain-containing protein [Streptomyces sp. H27-C3]|uniref:alpha/beta hydrolase fold domain-containing protein n=1 Tax=Streptomyces sp. H27-C3 TaxID=3046305 RepID=UPI0024BA52DF|nr:alpha/beta hydrolase fold domain-containing protein [Streptomyces sp. H27-C3]MDJ0463752.1 alpha/beta hydrolase fold domain-containing protein [Streptomyces sp. H27-C3]